MDTYPVETHKIPKHKFRLKYLKFWIVYRVAYDALFPLIEGWEKEINTGSSSIPKEIEKQINKKSILKWVVEQRRIEKEITSQFILLMSKYPDGSKMWVWENGGCERLALLNRDKIIEIQAIEDEYNDINQKYRHEVLLIKRLYPTIITSSDIVKNKDLIIEYNKRLKQSKFDQLLVENQNKFCNNIRNKHNEKGTKCARLHVNIDSFDNQGNKIQIPFVFLGCCYSSMSKYVPDDNTHSKYLKTRYIGEYDALILPYSTTYYGSYDSFWREYFFKEFYDIVGESTIIYGNSGLNGDIEVPNTQLNAFFQKNDNYLTTEKERTINQAIASKDILSICPDYIEPKQYDDSIDVSRVSNLPESIKDKSTIILFDRFGTPETAKHEVEKVVGYYQSRGICIQLIYWCLYYNRSEEDTIKRIENDYKTIERVKERNKEFIKACDNGDFKYVYKKYYALLLDNEHYALNEKVIREKKDQCYEFFINRIKNAIDNYDLIALKKEKQILESNRGYIPKYYIDIIDELFLQFEHTHTSGIPVEEIKLVVNYKIPDACDTKYYPFYRFPKKEGIDIYPHRKKRALRKGATEDMFYALLSNYFDKYPSFLILNDISLQVYEHGYPYEPDIAIISTTGENIRIDIEIDEPYTGIKRKPIHYLGCGDDQRDMLLNALGWIVIRFSEEQIVRSPRCCIQYIFSLLTKLNSNVSAPKILSEDICSYHESLLEMARWTSDEAVLMAINGYRESYISIKFTDDCPDQIFEKESRNEEETQIFSKASSEIVNNISESDSEIEPLAENTKNEDNKKCSHDIQTPREKEILSKLKIPSQGHLKPYILERTSPVNFQSPYESKDHYASVESVVAMQFPSMRTSSYIKYESTQKDLERALDNYYNKKNNIDNAEIKSTLFEYLLKYIDNEGLLPQKVSMRIFDDSKHIEGSIGFVSNGVLYECQVERVGAFSSQGNGYSNIIPDMPTYHVAKIADCKEHILKEKYGITVKDVIILLINPYSKAITKILLSDPYIKRFLRVKTGNISEK